jgi:hypothetical protein
MTAVGRLATTARRAMRVSRWDRRVRAQAAIPMNPVHLHGRHGIVDEMKDGLGALSLGRRCPVRTGFERDVHVPSDLQYQSPDDETEESRLRQGGKRE